MYAGSISATKRSAIGGIGSARCSLAKSGKSASLKCEAFASTWPDPELLTIVKVMVQNRTLFT